MISEQTHSHCGDVFSRKGVGGVADQQTCFTHSSGERRGRTTRDGDDGKRDAG